MFYKTLQMIEAIALIPDTRYRGEMCKKLKKEEPKPKPAKNDPWYQFMLATVQLDKDKDNNKPIGWHWFWGIYLLHKDVPEFLEVNLKRIQKNLPDGHWLKNIEAVYGITTSKTHIQLDPMRSKFLKEKSFVSFHNFLKKSKDSKDSKIKKINFSNLEFEDIAFFSALIFPIDTDFSNSKFSKNVIFTDAIFLETADFENAKFHEEPVTYKETAKFKNAIFKKVANFNKAIFNGYANFKGATFSGRTIFQQAKFKFHAPRFYNTTFNNELILNRIGLPEATKDELPAIIRDQYNKNDTDNDIYQKTVEENKSAYETLIYLMEEQKKHHDKHRFFREEMRWRQLGNILTKERRIEETQENPPIEYPCFLRIEHNFTIAFFWLYDNVADYGNGIGRALAWWLAHILVGVIVIVIMVLVSFGVCAFYGYPPSLIELGKNLVCAIPVSFTNANPVAFIGIDKGSLMDCYDSLKKLNSLSFGIIRVTQTFLGIILLFLLLTTLRVRFRLGGATSNNTK